MRTRIDCEDYGVVIVFTVRISDRGIGDVQQCQNILILMEVCDHDVTSLTSACGSQGATSLNILFSSGDCHVPAINCRYIYPLIHCLISLDLIRHLGDSFFCLPIYQPIVEQGAETTASGRHLGPPTEAHEGQGGPNERVEASSRVGMHD